MRKKFYCMREKEDYIQINIEDTISIAHITNVRFASILLSDKDAGELANIIKNYLTNKLLQIK